MNIGDVVYIQGDLAICIGTNSDTAISHFRLFNGEYQYHGIETHFIPVTSEHKLFTSITEEQWNT